MAIKDVTEENRAMREKLEQLKLSTDMVNSPPHYTSSDAVCDKCGDKIECIEITRHLDFLSGNIIKYLWRYKEKDGIVSLKKARWYLDDLIKMEEEKSKKIY
jgi:hypothetical protein